MTFIPDASVMLPYTVAVFILFATPGPDMSLFLAKTLSGGRWAGIAAMAGALTGCLVHTLAAALGLSALIAASATAFTALKIVGALYLVWLAIDAIRHGSALSVKAEARTEPNLKKIFLLGIGINLTNPKIVLFFITFLPQFVQVTDPHAQGKLVFLGLYFVLFSIPLAILMILGAERLIETLKAHPKIMRGIDYTFAGVFGFFAAKILATQGK
ncbi:MAG: LysE family translocator [Proteobacteria bacterium]|nr:LysE family translocator [Pseudomonadota bacterium]